MIIYKIVINLIISNVFSLQLLAIEDVFSYVSKLLLKTIFFFIMFKKTIKSKRSVYLINLA